jgi:hypothetical protein
MASSGYSITENVILTPGNTYLKTRRGESKEPDGKSFSYRVLYDRMGNKNRIVNEGKDKEKL